MWIDELLIERCEEQLACVSWIPEKAYVVLGNANVFERECIPEHCEQDSVPVLRRSGGGGAVVLHSGCVIVSVGAWVTHYYKNAEFFRKINHALIQCLSSAYPVCGKLTQEGLSDIVYEGRKLVGTSLFRSRHYLLYQASLLVDSQIPTIERYLQHPSQEPPYRERRSHRDFLTSLQDLSPGLSVQEVKELFTSHFSNYVRQVLVEDLCSAHQDQCGYLRKRFVSQVI